MADAGATQPVARRRSMLTELAGGLGDTGLFIPIAVALITLNGLNATAAFGAAGLVYMGTALYFRVPIPVQPLKGFAAAALALHLDAETIAAGALLMTLAMAVLAASGLANWLAARFPTVLIRGIQASVALLLVKAAVELAQKGNWPGLPPIDPAAGLAMAVVACAFLILAQRWLGLPGSLIVLGAGACVGLAVGGVPHLSAGPEAVSLSVPSGAAFATALGSLVLAQLPLTFGNSIVATADAERTYFGEWASRVLPSRLAASIGISNALAGLTSGLPLCHGAGGVTAHHRMGARGPAATFLAGALFLGLAIGLGSSLPALLTVLAPGALAGLLAYVAFQHALLASELEGYDDRVIAAGVGVVTLISGNLAIGVGAGVAVLVCRALWRRGAGRALDGIEQGEAGRAAA